MAGYRSPYETLSVSPDAEPIVIEAAYKALIKKYHPDLWLRDPGAQDRAATINQAFAILRDPETRSLCDQQLRAMRNAAQAASFRRVRPRPRGARWWSGWLVALLVAGATVIPWDDISLPAPRFAARSTPAPGIPAAMARAETGKTDAPAEAAGGEKPLPDGLLQMLTKAREEQSAFLVSMDEAAAAAPVREDMAQPARRPAARKRSRPRPNPPAESSEEPDFLERKGFIY